jgi:hypothetical protein
MKKYLKLLVCILIFFPGLSWATDVGLIMDQTAEYGGSENDDLFDFGRSGALECSGALIPWFSVIPGDNSDFYFSASVRADWKNETLSYIPELLRTEFSWRSESGEAKLGRMKYTDPLGFVADGLFDGAYISLDMGGASVNLGAWYTGLLYKERANITMTPAELQSYNTALDYENLMDTYFAPRRVVSAMGWEHLGLAEQAQLRIALLGQFDLTREDGINSQYLTGRLSVPVVDLIIDLGGCLETIEYSDEYKVALAGELKFTWMFAVTRLTLLGRYSGGMREDEDSLMTAFLPLSTVYQGNILKAKLSGLSVVSLDYLCRVHRTFSTGLTASCFMRNDLGTYKGYPLTADGENSSNSILGTELFGRLLWSPVSDIQINLGGGAFLPAMGNVARDAPLLWRAEVNLILVLY